MDTAEFLVQLENVRQGLFRRIAAIRNEEPVYGTVREMEGFLPDLDKTEREVRSGKLRVPGYQSLRGASRVVIDQWPWEDPLGMEICALRTSYDQL